MADDDLPREYDAIVLGTGLTECVIAAALARIGFRVLHLDKNDYYSSEWAVFNFDGMQRWIKQEQTRALEKESPFSSEPYQELLEDGEVLIPLPQHGTGTSNVVEKVFMKEAPADIVEVEDKTSKLSLASEAAPNITSQETTESSEIDGQNVNNLLQDSDKRFEESVVSETVSQGDHSTQSQGKYQPLTESEEQSENAKIGQEKNEENSVGQLDVAESTGKVEEQPKSDKTEPNYDNVEFVVQESDHKAQGAGVKVAEKEPKKPDKVREWTLSELNKEWRRFNLDLAPKMLYSRGSLVELLISSDIAKYCEFKTVTRILTHLNGKVEQVPCSRADVFGSKAVTMVEKRMLMKFLTFCMEYEKHAGDYQEYQEKPYTEFLKSKKLSATVQHYICQAIAMSTDKTNTIEGLRRTKRFLQSIGRYGNTPFLWPLYGSGELPQCFCRMCAVFGGTYILRRTARALIMSQDNKCVGIIDTEGLRIKCNWVIMEGGLASEALLPENSRNRKSSRGIYITDKSLCTDDQDQITLMHLPPANGQTDPITVMELSPATYACPKGLHVVHLTCQGCNSAEEDLKPAEDLLFKPVEQEADHTDTRPRVLWSLHLNQMDNTGCDLNEKTPENVVLVAGPGATLDFEHSILEARQVFEKICPGEEFLPKAPNPEDIIFDDGQEAANGDSGFEADVNDEGADQEEGHSQDTDSEVDAGVAEEGSEWS